MALSERQKIAHLLRRFGFGASEAELDYYSQGGLPGAIQKLLNFDSAGPMPAFEPQNFMAEKLKGGPRLPHVQIWWLLTMCATRRPLEEKLTLFWHHHFATAAMKVDVPVVMYRQNVTIRQHCLGKFQDLLLNLSKDPAMLYWLDNQFNVKGKPNENFAREIMELFTLGIGHYSEEDVQEAARAFTGWTYGVGRRLLDKPRPVSTFQFRRELHDEGTKSILGNKGKFDGEDVCGILTGHPETAKFIARKMWEFFGYLKPEEALVDRLAKTFRDSGLQIRALVRAIMESPEFYSEKCYRKAYKNPVEFCVATFRQLGIGSALGKQMEQAAAEESSAGVRRTVAGAALQPMLRSTIAMGMEVLNPPDVAGWKLGPDWISSATMVERMKWAEIVFGPRSRFQILPLLGSDQPSELVKFLCSALDVEYPASKIKQLEQAAEKAAGTRLTTANANKSALAVARLIFGSPEFQFC